MFTTRCGIPRCMKLILSPPNTNSQASKHAYSFACIPRKQYLSKNILSMFPAALYSSRCTEGWQGTFKQCTCKCRLQLWSFGINFFSPLFEVPCLFISNFSINPNRVYSTGLLKSVELTIQMIDTPFHFSSKFSLPISLL